MAARNGFSRRYSLALRGAVLATASLLVYGCGQSGDQSASAGQATRIATDSEAASAARAGIPAVVDETAAPDVAAVVPVPVAAATASAPAAAPLRDAATIASEITRGDGIQRIRHGDGWAWMRDGKIIRTASGDGKEVAYFRNGSDSPFLLQKGDREYAYSGGKVTRAYDKGHSRAVDSNDRGAATQMAHKAKDDRDAAARIAAKHTANRAPTSPPSRSTRDASRHDESGPARPDGNNRNSSSAHETHNSRDGHSTHASPTPTPTPTHTRGSRHDQERRPTDRPTSD